MVEGAPLLREYRLKKLIEGSNPSLSATHQIMEFWQDTDPAQRILDYDQGTEIYPD